MRLFASGGGKRAAILRSALELFVEKGYWGVSIPDLTRAADVALSTFYANFSGKQEVADRVFQACVIELDRGLAEAIPHEGGPRELFDALWQGLAEHVDSDAHAFAFGQTPDPTFLSAENRDHDPVPPSLVQFLSLPQVAAELKPLLPRLLAACVWGVFLEMVRGHRLNSLVLDTQALTDFARCAWDAIAA